jgi:polar amino acid transport system permease protein
MPYDWNFAIVLGYLPKLLEGGAHTIALSAASIALAAPIGIVLGVIRQRRIPFLAPLAVVYIDFFRTSVALVLICWCYYALPVLLGVNLSTFTAVMIAIGLQASAVHGRAGAGRPAVDLGRPVGGGPRARHAGLARLRYIVLPQAARRMIPLFFLLMVEVVKTTTLAGVVTYPEIVYDAFRVATEIYRPIETFTIVGIICFIFCSRWVASRSISSAASRSSSASAAVPTLGLQLPVAARAAPVGGLVNTAKLWAVALACGLAIGLVMGILRSTPSAILRSIGTVYVEAIRNTPGLVQLIWVFYALPILTGVQSSAWLAAAVSLSLYTGAYSAEIYPCRHCLGGGGTMGGGARAGIRLPRPDALCRPAAGTDAHDPGLRQPRHRAGQGHDLGLDHRLRRASLHRQDHRRGPAAAARDLHRRHAHLHRRAVAGELRLRAAGAARGAQHRRRAP